MNLQMKTRHLQLIAQQKHHSLVGHLQLHFRSNYLEQIQQIIQELQQYILVKYGITKN